MGAGPYGITQVDVPGILQMYEAGKDNRTRRLLQQRELQKSDLEIKKLTGLAAAFQKFSQAEGGDQSTRTPGIGDGVNAERSGAYEGAPTTVDRVPSPSATPAPAAAPFNPWNDRGRREELIRDLTVADPEQAMKWMDQFAQMDEKQMAATKTRLEYKARALNYVRGLPPQQRAAARDALAPELEKMGFPRQQIMALPLDDASLEGQIALGRDVEKVIEGTTPKVMAVTAGGSLNPVTPGSPYPDFGGGGGAAATNEEGPAIIQRATSSGKITRAELERLKAAFGPNGQAALGGWMEKNRIEVSDGSAAVQSKTVNGQTYYMVNGKWYDNPEGR